MVNKITKIDRCLCCVSDDLELVLDLGFQPLANNLLSKLEDEVDVYPLKLNYCLNCGHLQLADHVNPDLIFKHYLYVSGTSNTLKKYFRWFAKQVTKDKDYVLNVLDIACNDGSQLDAFKELGHKTFGIDPAINLHEISSKNHFVVCDYLRHESISSFKIKFDLIIAQNVFAHVVDPFNFLTICGEFLAPKGEMYIQTSQAKMLERGQFDTIYHEHISFFSEQSMYALVNRTRNLRIAEHFLVPVHGESHVFKVVVDNYGTPIFQPKHENYNIIQQFRESYQISKSAIHNRIKQYKGFKFVVYGAAAKSVVYMNSFGLVAKEVVDANPLKQGRFIPGVKSKIVPLDYFAAYDKPIVWLILAWNFEKEIRQEIISMRPNSNDIFLLPDHAK
jgi:2-polyprenyl-3-methyl-5-hydroxy-6-metoxy-1,4-benzoquinol methylase